MEPKIELAKLREFGEIIGDTFLFIRQNFKDLLKSFFVICGFFIVALIAASFLQQYKIMRLFGEASSGAPQTFGASSYDFWVTQAVLMVIMFATITAVNVMVLCYMAVYKQKGNQTPTAEEVWGYFKYYYFRLMGGAIVVAVLLIPAFMLCIIPGVYLYPILGLIFPIIVFENASFGYSFNRSFQLIKNNWWVTSGAIIVTWIIVYVLTVAITLPAAAVNMANVWLRPQNLPQLSMGQILLSVVLQGFVMILYIIPAISISLCYFNLAEHKEGSSLLDRINKFGDPGQQNHLPTEEY